MLDFKTVGEKGIRNGMIKSIIKPELAAHVRREAVRFIDELKRNETGDNLNSPCGMMKLRPLWRRISAVIRELSARRSKPTA